MTLRIVKWLNLSQSDSEFWKLAWVLFIIFIDGIISFGSFASIHQCRNYANRNNLKNFHIVLKYFFYFLHFCYYFYMQKYAHVVSQVQKHCIRVWIRISDILSPSWSSGTVNKLLLLNWRDPNHHLSSDEWHVRVRAYSIWQYGEMNLNDYRVH